MRKRPINVEKMKYQTNSLASAITLLSLGLSVIAMFTMITYDSFGAGEGLRVAPDHMVAIEIGMGIVTMLLTFLAAEKVKYYDRKWSCFGLFVLAGIDLFRIAFLPTYCLEKGWIPVSVYQSTVTLFALAAALLIAAGAISTAKVALLDRFSKRGA